MMGESKEVGEKEEKVIKIVCQCFLLCILPTIASSINRLSSSSAKHTQAYEQHV